MKEISDLDRVAPEVMRKQNNEYEVTRQGNDDESDERRQESPLVD
jgi:hypothetical protein